MTQKLILRHGDCVDVLKGYGEGSIGAVISDPPYGLSFMGKDFDKLGEGAAQRKWHEVWLTEAYRILRPGGVLKAFSGTRTFHHLALAMEQAGFDLLPMETWNYGSGFPKSRHIGKALDKDAGAEREVLGPYHTPEGGQILSTYNNWQADSIEGGAQGRRVPMITAPATEAAQRWEGWGTALKPAWEPVLVGRKPDAS